VLAGILKELFDAKEDVREEKSGYDRGVSQS
jgi:hypothetical protein